MTTAREEMLDAIRNALKDRGDSKEFFDDRIVESPAGSSESVGGGVADGGGRPGAREDRGIADMGVLSDRVELLQSRISDYQATVLRCPTAALSATVVERLRSRGVERLVVPSDLPEDWISGLSSTDLEVRKDGDLSPLSTDQLACVDAVVTGCAVAIAETGTLVLDGGPGQGRRAISLLPDYHLCVVLEEQVVGSIREGISRLQPPQGGNLGPLTLISGPSATSDIELIRVEGVHGPRTLDVILVEDH